MVTITVRNGAELQRQTEVKGVIHNVFILDASGSMGHRDYGKLDSETKYDAAIRNINSEITELKANENTVLVSVYEFDSVKHGEERITEHCFATSATDLNTIKGRGPSGNTPLYQTIDYVVTRLLRKVTNDDKVILNIYTDGQHNCPWGAMGTSEACKGLINDIEKNRGFAVTFVGTERDTALAVRDLGIGGMNVMSYDGTAKGLSESMTKARKSRGMAINTFYSSGTFDSSNLYNQPVTNTVDVKDNYKGIGQAVDQNPPKSLQDLLKTVTTTTDTVQK